MKKLFIFNVLIFSGLAGFSQNLTNVYMGNQNEVFTQQSSQFINPGNVGRSSALSNFNQTNQSPRATAQKPPTQQKKTVSVNNKVKNEVKINEGTNINQLNNVNVDNNVNLDNNPNLDNNVNDQMRSNPSIINTQSQVNNQNKAVINQPVVVQESHGSDFKQIGLSGRDYSGGGKLKKGQKNFYKQEKHKVKHKKRPAYKRVKYHTAQCASW
jgi:hypothetical protein